MLEASRGKTNASGHDLLSDQALDPFHAPVHRGSVPHELRVIGVFGGQNLRSPERIQDLKLSVVALYQISEAHDLLHHGLYGGDEPVRLLYGEGLAGKRLGHDQLAVSRGRALQEGNRIEIRRARNVRELSTNAVLRWEYKPGSTLFVVRARLC